LQGIEHWKKFYRDHNEYFKVGRVSHKPIDPSSPIPEHCDPKKAEKQRQERAGREKAAAAATERTKEAQHEEL
jgi:hypothetical protein